MRLLSDWRIRGLLGVLALGALVFLALPEGSRPAAPWQESLRTGLFPWSSDKTASSKPVLAADYGKVPLFFEENAGQSHQDVKYLSRGPGYTLFLTADEAVFQLNRPAAGNSTQGGKTANAESAVLRARLLGANRRADTHGEEEQAGRSNYFIGNDKKQWHTGIANYGRVRYEAVYPGIDLVYYGNQGQLEYDFVVQPGANPDIIRIGYEGAEKLHIDDHGNLLAETSAGPVTQYKPIVYQTIAGQRHPVEGSFALASNEVSFKLGAYDRSQPLVIDPVLVYSTYMGGGASLNRIAVDAAGNAYITGSTSNNDYPTKNSLPSSTTPGGTYTNAVITKLAADGKTLVYSTYLGGSNNDTGLDIAVAAADGSVYVSGTTLSDDFPTEAPYQATNKNSRGSGFLVRLDPSGQSLLFSTYFGGKDFDDTSKGFDDFIAGVAIATDGSVYVTGNAGGKDFPLKNELYGYEIHPNPADNTIAFVAHFTAAGALDFSTLLGGGNGETGEDIALDSADNIYVTGSTSSSNFPQATNTYTGVQPTTDAYIARLTADGQTLQYATYLGGSSNEAGAGIAFNAADNSVWITGDSYSGPSGTNFPSLNGNPKIRSNNPAAFIAGFNANDGSLKAATILGAQTEEGGGLGYDIAISNTGDIHVVGFILLADVILANPVTNMGNAPAVADPNAVATGYVGKFSPGDLINPIYFTDLRGSGTETGINGVAVDATSAVYVAGGTASTDFPISPGAFQSVLPLSGNINGFVAKIGSGPAIQITLDSSAIPENGSTTLHWNAPDADTCTGSATPDAGAPTFNGAQPTSGSLGVMPTSIGNHVYTLTCTNTEGTSAETATLRVAGAPVVSMTMTPSTVVTGQNAVLTWSALDAASCEGIAPSPADFLGAHAVTGSMTVNSNTAETRSYQLMCTGVGGSSTASKTLVIKPRPTVTLSAITTTPGLSYVGETITWQWTAEHADSCTATGAVEESGLPVTGNRTSQPTAIGSTSLTITCTDITGTTASDTVALPVYDSSLPPTILTFSTNREPSNTIAQEQTVRLTWTTTNASTCMASSDATVPDSNWNGVKPVNDSSELVPLMPALGYGSSTTYTLTCSRPGGGSYESSASVAITINHPRPRYSVSLSPSTIRVGETTTLSWSSTHATACTASGLWSGTLGPSGTQVIPAPATTGIHDLRFSCSGVGGTSAETVRTLGVNSAPVTGGDDGSTQGSNSSGPVDGQILLGLGLLGLLHRYRRLRLHR